MNDTPLVALILFGLTGLVAGLFFGHAFTRPVPPERPADYHPRPRPPHPYPHRPYPHRPRTGPLTQPDRRHLQERRTRELVRQ